MTRRITHAHDGELAVFLIGLRVNRPWRPDVWLPAVAAMTPMLVELERNRARAQEGAEEWWGFFGARTLIGATGPTVVQYWRSVEDIYAYANDTDRAHRPAWTAFYRRLRRADGAVGVWHETYRVPAKGHESLYLGMPPAGLARFTGDVAASRRGARARERMAS